MTYDEATIRDIQSRVRVSADGVWGPETLAGLDAWLTSTNPANEAAFKKLWYRGESPAYATATIEDIQRRVGASPDGIWGLATLRGVVAWWSLPSNDATSYRAFEKVWTLYDARLVLSGWLFGVDVGDLQGDIDWGSVAQAGPTWAIVRATKGTRVVDPCWRVNVAGAKAAGLPVGPYHYACLQGTDTTGSPEEEADLMLRTLEGIDFTLPWALDLETERLRSYVEAHSAAAAVAWIERFLARVGRPMMLYWSHRGVALLGEAANKLKTSATWWAIYQAPPLSASPPHQPEGWGWTMWQCTSHGHVPGISGAVDLSVFSGGEAAWERWLASAHE